MITSNDLKTGMTIIHNGVLHEVVEFQHIKPGKGHAFVRTKLKNLVNFTLFEFTFRSKQPMEQAIVDKKQLQYLYRDKNIFYFMDPETYDQIPVDIHFVEDYLEYMKENEFIHFTLYNGDVVKIDMPDFINLKVQHALPGVKGDTAQGGSKPVTLETGKVVQVPLFINEGDVLKIDTRTGKYVERVKIG